MAKSLDPSDPTPYFYEAIKQTTNRPVEALQDLKKSIDLNDNRAVYRSRLLLDSDLRHGARASPGSTRTWASSSAALVEGWKSVNTDPSHFSGHRFLADSYAALPRHQIARVSELLVSQLLQPINITPIQPRLAESNLFISGAEGPSPFLQRLQPIVQPEPDSAPGKWHCREQHTLGEEVVVSGIYNKASFSMGQNYFKTDGVRENNGLRDNIFDAYVQYQLFPRTSIQAEYRYRDNKRGDTELLFWKDNISKELNQEENRDHFRLGFLQSFSPQSNLIGNFSYTKRDASVAYTLFFDPAIIGAPPPDIRDALGNTTDRKGLHSRGVAATFTGRSNYINTVVGAGYFNINQDPRVQ